MRQHIESSQREASAALEALGRGRVFSCGNGGSMCDAMHFAEKLTGRYRRDRGALAATAISDAGHISCVGNDLGYEYIFSRYLEAHGRQGDCLVALTTSGTSKNVIRVAETARSAGMSVVVLSGRPSEVLSNLSTVNICTPDGTFADRVQELQHQGPSHPYRACRTALLSSELP